MARMSDEAPRSHDVDPRAHASRGPLVSLRIPLRPQPTDPRARRLMEWAEVAYYIFWLAFSAAVAVRAFELYGSSFLR